jgi:hypothetical protein
MPSSPRKPAPLPPARPRREPSSLVEPQYRGAAYDAWNSVGAGHQRAETRGPMGWRESRNKKLQSQFRGGRSGDQRLSDTAGPGAARNSVVDMLRNQGTMPAGRGNGRASSAEASAAVASMSAVAPQRAWSPPVTEAEGPDDTLAGQGQEQRGGKKRGGGWAEEEGQSDNEARPATTANSTMTHEGHPRGIFDGLVVYVNGSTHPLISDHKLKRLLSENGARTSLHLGRRQVTHVILGKPSGPSGGAGGGLAGGKLDKEIRRVGGIGIKFVGVEW